MTIKKVKNALNRVERKVDDFYITQSQEDFEKAKEEINKFNRDIGIMLWDEIEGMARSRMSKGVTNAD